MSQLFDGKFEDRNKAVEKILNADETFDILHRVIDIGGKKAALWAVDGFLDGELSEKILEFLRKVETADMPQDCHGFLKKCIPHMDILLIETEEDFIKYILSGLTCILVDGYSQVIGMDLREYPSRSVEEPDQDKVLRGSRDGFVETLVPNTALIRRRIRDVNLIFQIQNVGRSSKTDIAVAYMKGRAKKENVELVMERIKNIDVDSLTMNQQSLSELLFPGGWFNPLPKFKYTERPDTAAACILEGSIIVMVDNSPSVMIIPTSVFDIIEDINDYYFPPITGTYLRLTRMVTNLLSVFLTPVFLLLITNPDWIPDWLSFIKLADEVNVPPLIQLLILEFAVDGLKMASVNSPSMLNTPLSIVAGIVFGDYTVDSGWFNPEIMLYMAFVTVANYTQSNMEMTYAIKFFRLMLIVLTGIFGVSGFVVGVVLIIIALFTTKTFIGKGYLYPLIPFNKVQLMQRFLRVSLPKYEKMHPDR